MSIKTKILRFLSPNYAELLPAKVISESDGHAYIKFKDSEGSHKVILPDDVKPISFKSGGLLKQQFQLFIMARDNFVSMEKNNFAIKGAITREMISEIAEWGSAEALIRASTAKPLISGSMGTILIAIGIAAVIWLIFQNLPAGILPI